MNFVVLIGNLGADAEYRVPASGEGIVKFSLATSEKWTAADGSKQEKTSWHRVTKFGKGNEKLSQYLTKGTKVAVTGRLQYGSYDKDGVTHYTTDVIADRLELLGSPNGGNKTAPATEPEGDPWD